MKLWVLVLSLTCAGVLARRPADATSFLATSREGFSFIQITDPQLGMLNMYAKGEDEQGNPKCKDCSAELDMLQQAAEHIKRLKPAFVALTGDMQNFWPSDDGRNADLTKQVEVGDNQAGSVKEVVDDIEKEGIPVHVLPGNHDLDDAPTDEITARYKNIWGEDHYSFTVQDVKFIGINSQLFYDHSRLTEGQAKKEAQMKYLRDQVLAAEEDPNVQQIVALSHIAPFVGSVWEEFGWSNWNLQDRGKALQITNERSSKKWVELWVCGHLHGNAGTKVTLNSRSVEVVVTSSVGSVMLWDDKQNNTYSPQEASEIVTQPIRDAFGKHIMAGDPANIRKRILARPDKSGLRVFQFLPDGTYRHRWLTLKQMEKVNSIDDAFVIDIDIDIDIDTDMS